jgi:hypothetical protein
MRILGKNRKARWDVLTIECNSFFTLKIAMMGAVTCELVKSSLVKRLPKLNSLLGNIRLLMLAKLGIANRKMPTFTTLKTV